MAAAPATTPDEPTGNARPDRKTARGLGCLTRRPWWPWLTRGVAAAFLLGVAWLLIQQARTIDWSAVGQALLAVPGPVLLVAGAFALASHCTYGTYDWVGRHCTGHGLPLITTQRIAMTSYTFTLNLGSLIGGVGVRYRLYDRQGLRPGTIGQIIGTSVLTNWLGYLLLAGVLPWLWQPPALLGWSLPTLQWKLLGGALAVLPLAYVLLCTWRQGESLRLRGRSFPLPRWPVALGQVLVSAFNWMLMGAALWTVLQGHASYWAALATVLLGAVAGLVLRVPAGLGVLEAVGVALLAGDTLGRDEALAAMLAYRALYYLLPLSLGALAFGAAELHWRQRGGTANQGAGPKSP